MPQSHPPLAGCLAQSPYQHLPGVIEPLILRQVPVEIATERLGQTDVQAQDAQKQDR